MFSRHLLPGGRQAEATAVQGGDLLNPDQLMNLAGPGGPAGCALCGGFCQIPLVVFDSLFPPPPPSHYA